MKTLQIVAPVDLDEHSGKVISYAANMAEKLAAELTVLHIVEPIRAMGDMILGSTTIETFNAKRYSQSKELLSTLVAGCSGCRAELIVGEIVEEIVNFAEKREADLIIIGTHGSKGIEKLLLGSVAERVVKIAPCPTLVMNPYKHHVP
ncbi:MAG: universal stress protein [Deltaproteobacteria bacterium]|nr:MAG: universal stress protein [Deltaproteobacteria bacterium]